MELGNMGTKEIAKTIREELKQFRGYKFSVVYDSYSMGSSITVALMQSPIKIIRDMEDISEDAILDKENHRYAKAQIAEMQSEKYHQLNPYQLREDFKETAWCNGVFLTKEGHELLKKVVGIVDKYHVDRSDAMTDYYDVNFHFDIDLGKWNKPMIEA